MRSEGYSSLLATFLCVLSVCLSVCLSVTTLAKASLGSMPRKRYVSLRSYFHDRTETVCYHEDRAKD